MKKFCLYIFFRGNLSYYLLRNKLHSFHFIFFSPLKNMKRVFSPFYFLYKTWIFLFALFFRGQLNLANLCVHFSGLSLLHIFFSSLSIFIVIIIIRLVSEEKKCIELMMLMMSLRRMWPRLSRQRLSFQAKKGKKYILGE